jgi:hypothetical protein
MESSTPSHFGVCINSGQSMLWFAPSIEASVKDNLQLGVSTFVSLLLALRGWSGTVSSTPSIETAVDDKDPHFGIGDTSGHSRPPSGNASSKDNLTLGVLCAGASSSTALHLGLGASSGRAEACGAPAGSGLHFTAISISIPAGDNSEAAAASEINFSSSTGLDAASQAEDSKLTEG